MSVKYPNQSNPMHTYTTKAPNIARNSSARDVHPIQTIVQWIATCCSTHTSCSVGEGNIRKGDEWNIFHFWETAALAGA